MQDGELHYPLFVIQSYTNCKFIRNLLRTDNIIVTGKNRLTKGKGSGHHLVSELKQSEIVILRVENFKRQFWLSPTLCNVILTK